MAREVKKRKSETTVDDSTATSTTSNSNVTPQSDNQATDTTTDIQVNTAPQMSAREMLRFSLNVIYDVGLISSFNLSELVDMMSSKQCRIVRSQRSKLLNAITQEEDPESWNLAQRLITRAKSNDTVEGQTGINKILVRLKNMEKRLLGDSEHIFVENSRYLHQKDLVGGRCLLTKVGLFKAVIASNDVFCLGVLERSHMLPVLMRLTFKYSFQEASQILFLYVFSQLI